MFLKLRNRIKLIAGVIVTAVGVPLVLAVSPTVHALPAPFTYCTSYGGSSMGCLNAWGGGPFVKLNVSPYWNYNDWFSLIGTGGGTVALEYVNTGTGGGWEGNCVGDAYNLSSRADASLDPCPGSSSGAGWGTYMTTYSCSDGQGHYGYSFHDNHWNGYVGSVQTDGSPIYLNVQSPTCYLEISQS